MMELNIKDGRLFLDGMKLSGVSHYHIEIDSAFPNGKANLKIDMCVDFKTYREKPPYVETQGGIDEPMNYSPLSSSHTAV